MEAVSSTVGWDYKSLLPMENTHRKCIQDHFSAQKFKKCLISQCFRLICQGHVATSEENKEQIEYLGKKEMG